MIFYFGKIDQEYYRTKKEKRLKLEKKKIPRDYQTEKKRKGRKCDPIEPVY